jgi:hypothetical protein
VACLKTAERRAWADHAPEAPYHPGMTRSIYETGRVIEEAKHWGDACEAQRGVDLGSIWTRTSLGGAPPGSTQIEADLYALRLASLHPRPRQGSIDPRT